MEYIIDGNSMIHIISNSVVSILKDKFPVDYELSNSPNNELSEYAKKQVRNSFFKYLNSYIFPFKNYIKHLHITIDDVSWRKRYVYAYYEKYENDDSKFVYKGNRVIDNNNFILNNIFAYIKHELIDELKSINGLYVYSVIGAEGDDIIAYLVEKHIKETIVIFSGDSDIAQLVTNVGHKVIMLYPSRFKNKQRVIYVNKYDSEFNFNTDYTIDSIVDSMLRSNYYKLKEYEPGKEILTKIVAGDKKSDNINSVYVRKNKVGGFINITPKRVKRFLQPIFDKYSDIDILKMIDTFNEKFIEDVGNTLKNEFKIKDEDVMKNIHKSIKRNIILIRLNFAVIIDGIYDLIDKVYEYYFDDMLFDYFAFSRKVE